MRRKRIPLSGRDEPAGISISGPVRRSRLTAVHARPGQLSPQTYADLMAFILTNNGYPAGDKEFPIDPGAQQQMTLKR